MTIKSTINLLGFGLLILTGLSAQTGYDIAKKVDERSTPKDMTADLTMILTSGTDKTRSSTLHSVSMDGGEKQIIWFLAPADDKGVSFLKIENDDRDDEMRLWLPAFKKVRRISSSKKGDSFMGSDLSYEDLTNRELNEYTYQLLGEEFVDGVPCYKLEAVPKPEAESTYSRHVSWIQKETYLPVKEESYDRAGRLHKTKTIEYTRIKDYDLPQEIFVRDVQKNHSTRLTFDNMSVDDGVRESLFHERNLKRLPR